MGEGERKLWLAVLEQAYADAEMSFVGESSSSEPSECHRARRYLRADSTYESDNLKLICEFANLPADRVVTWARKRYPAECALDLVGSNAGSLALPLTRSQTREQGFRIPQLTM